MEAAPCDDWSVARFMIPNKIIFTAAIKKKKKKTPNSLGPEEYLCVGQNRTFNGGVTR